MRVEGWEGKLNEYFEEIFKKDFKWGECDCLIFASDSCMLLRKIDPMSQKYDSDPKTIRGCYDTEHKAKALIKEYRKSVRDIMDVHFKRVKPAFAKRGDVVLYKNAFGVVSGRGKAFFKTEKQGLESINLKDCLCAWDI